MAVELHTYHCLCSTLILSTTHNLPSLPRRAPPALDTAIILPLPPSPPKTTPSSPSMTTTDLPPSGYTLLLSTTTDRKPIIVRREDGFEKRILQRCGRCKVVVGYEVVNSGSSGGEGEGMEVDGGKGKEREGEGKQDEEYKGRIFYLLPNAVMSTEFMMAGKKVSEEDVGVGKNVGVGVFGVEKVVAVR